jgi:hypothetical protein
VPAEPAFGLLSGEQGPDLGTLEDPFPVVPAVLAEEVLPREKANGRLVGTEQPSDRGIDPPAHRGRNVFGGRHQLTAA